MQIDKDGEFFVARIKFSEREIFRRAQWFWHPVMKKWVTREIEKVLPYREFTTGAARVAVEVFDNGIGKRIKASMATSSDFQIPMPPHARELMGFQRAGVEFCAKKTGVLIADPPGLGKAGAHYSKVSTPSGWKTMGELRVGSVIHGTDGLPQTVTGVFPQGPRELFRVTFRDGTFTDCDEEHLWAVKDANAIKRKQDWKVKTLKELMKWGITKSDGKNKWQVPLAGPMIYPKASLPIEPYVLGALLGDGSLGHGSIRLSKGGRDQEILDRVAALVPDEITPTQDNYQGDTQVLRLAVKGNLGPGKHKNTILNSLRDLGLRVTGEHKFIPDLYKFSSVDQRVELLRGLMDTDGSAVKNRIVFHTCTERLGDDVCDLVRSLGGVAIKRHYVRSDGKSDEWQINVKITTFCPFHLKRKAEQWWVPDRRENRPSKFIKSVESIGVHEAICIAVSNPDHLYITDDYIVTHNTNQAISTVNTIDRKRLKKILIICPASLKKNWMREWKMWSVHTDLKIGQVTTIKRDKLDRYGKPMRAPPDIPGRQGKKIKETVDVWPEDCEVVVVNKALMDRHTVKIKEEGIWSVLIVDEAHEFCNEKSQSGMFLWGGGRGRNKVQPITAYRRIFLTGTPIMTAPKNMWIFCRELDPKGLGSDWLEYHERYCGGEKTHFGYDISGATNLVELNRRLRASFMLRRDKKEVLKELPPKTREIIVLPDDGMAKAVEQELTEVRQYLALYQQDFDLEQTDAFDHLMSDVSSGVDYEYADLAQGLQNSMFLDFGEMSQARQALAIAKAPLVKEHVDRLLDSGEKVILFCVHTKVADFFKKAYAGQCAAVTGSTPVNRRQDEVDKFQNDPDCRIFIGNIDAAGVGFTLTAASIVVFAEMTWVPAKLEQAEDRAWRIGQLCNVLVQHLVVDGSIDARIVELVLARMEEIEQALGVAAVREGV